MQHYEHYQTDLSHMQRDLPLDLAWPNLNQID
jgi:hypothetical protein